ncbi:transmembrane prolyl 4-hydroxylase-like [Tiliqua scincoides]|uniref:transmembrane prolyl 4-hydroxylase-like n=1 Tax=Tiliqua scincoides TaxID=71010 RepID=UPI003462770B
MAGRGEEPSRGRSRPTLIALLVLADLYVVGVVAVLLFLSQRGYDGGPGSDFPGSAWPSLSQGGSRSDALPRLEGVQVGYNQKVVLFPNKINFMKTLSLKPLVFEIQDFLSEDECKLIIRLAEQEGLEESEIRFSGNKVEHLEMLGVDQMKIFSLLDYNQDGELQILEVFRRECLGNGQWLTPEDVQEMYIALKADPDGNGVLSVDEFKEVNLQDVNKYIDMKKANTSDLVRKSQQAWLVQGKGAHPIMHSIRQRVIRLTRLPAEIIEHSEALQVVQYDQGGYYHAHWDSKDAIPGIASIHFEQFVDISPCHSSSRYATVLFYLNNVTGGGETSFPIADNSTYDLLSLIQNNIDLRDTYRHCDKGNLRIKPMQGTAILWYNHLSNDEGWVGEIDDYSLHGGCLVTEGTKWIANQWINVDHSKTRQLLFQKVMAQHANDGDQSKGSLDKSCHTVRVKL